MPRRKSPWVSGEIYHVFNRSIAKQPIFLNMNDYQRAIEVISFYLFQKPRLRFSHFNRLPINQRQKFLKQMKNENRKLVEVLAYCIMPNHFHFLLKQLENQGISKFMNNFQHSYANYFNLKNKRTGSLMQAMFKGVRIETDEQLLHVTRYIHLNPVTSFIIKIADLSEYPWSSFKEYMTNDLIVTSKPILGYFKSKGAYKEFVFNQTDYQQKLAIMKHLSLE